MTREEAWELLDEGERVTREAYHVDEEDPDDTPVPGTVYRMVLYRDEAGELLSDSRDVVGMRNWRAAADEEAATDWVVVPRGT